jgi:hypothetical protein
MRTRLWTIEDSFISLPWVNRAGGGVMINRYGITIVDFKKIGYKDEPIVLAKDIT